MEIRTREPSWNEDLPVFASPAFLRCQSPESGWLVGGDGGTPRFALPYTVHAKARLRLLRLHSAPIRLGPDDPAGTATDAEQEFLDSLAAFLRTDLGVDLVAQPPTYVLFARCPAGAVAAPFGSYRIDLGRDETALWEAVHSKHRNVIRNAQKNGVRIERGPQWRATAHRFLAETMARSDMLFESRREFERTLDALGGNVEVYAALAGDEPQGCAVIPFSRHSAHYLWGGGRDKPLLGALNLLQWEIIRDMRSRGVRTYDLVGARLKAPEGSKLEGIQRFKSRLGATLVEGLLWKLPLHPFRAHLYERLWRLRNWRSAGRAGDIIDQERARLRREHGAPN